MKPKTFFYWDGSKPEIALTTNSSSSSSSYKMKTKLMSAAILWHIYIRNHTDVVITQDRQY